MVGKNIEDRERERGAHVSDVPPYLFYMLEDKMVWE